MADYFITDPAAADIEGLWNGLVDRGGAVASADRFMLEFFRTARAWPTFPTSARRATTFRRGAWRFRTGST